MFKRQPRGGAPILDRDALARDGLAILRGVFGDEDRQRLRDIYRQMQERVATGKITRTAVHTAGDHAELFDTIDQMEPVRAVARATVGGDYCRLVSRFLIKDHAYNGPIPAHQDYPYFGGFPNKVNLFVPLTPCTPANGMLSFLKGSHLYGPVERGVIDVARYPDLEEVYPDLDVGDLLVADYLTWHASPPATEFTDRVMVQIVYQPSSDPSSKHLVGGRLLNPVTCLNRHDPMASRETEINLQNARVMYEHGHYGHAERIALDVLSTDQDNANLLLLLKRIYAATGDVARATEYAARARAAAEAALKACEAEG